MRGTEVTGGLSSVFRATDLWSEGQSVAIKILGRPQVDSDVELDVHADLKHCAERRFSHRPGVRCTAAARPAQRRRR